LLLDLLLIVFCTSWVPFELALHPLGRIARLPQRLRRIRLGVPSPVPAAFCSSHFAESLLQWSVESAAASALARSHPWSATFSPLPPFAATPRRT